MLVLSKHVYKGVDMKPCLPGPNAEHHARSEDSLTHMNLPIEPSAIKNTRASYSSSAIGPVRVKVSDPLLGPVKANLGGRTFFQEIMRTYRVSRSFKNQETPCILSLRAQHAILQYSSNMSCNEQLNLM